jgi:hypothetical protein
MKQETNPKIFWSPWVVPLFLLVICMLAYGLLIPTLGYYWDDWPYALVNHRFGPSGYPEFVASDRPYSAWIFMALTWLLGEQPVGYHITGIFLYWICAVLFWRLIRLVWPEHPNEALWAAMLFAVYPGFLGHLQAIIYNHHFTAMALYLFSLVATILALKKPKENRYWHIPAVLAMALSQFSIEYYLGWEAVRPVLVWIVLSRRLTDRKHRLEAVLKQIVPYWLATFGFLAWRLLVFQFSTYQPVGREEAGVVSLVWLLDILSQVADAVIVAWRRALPILSSQDYSAPFWLAYLGLTMLAIGLVFAFLTYFNQHSEKKHSDKKHSAEKTNAPSDSRYKFTMPAFVVALVGIGAAGWPFWLVDLQLRIQSFFYSRFTLAFVPWASLFVVVLVHLIYNCRKRWAQWISLALVALLVGGSVGWHFWNANHYRNDWIEVQRYFQQLVTRAPGIKPGTTLVVNDMRSITLYQDDSLTAILNWTYAPENYTHAVDYVIFYLSVRLGNSLPALEPGLPIEHPMRSMQFSGSTDQILVVHYDPPGCLRIIDGRQPDRVPLTLPEKLVPAVPLSDISLINPAQSPPAAPPATLFDLTTTGSWCLYYQEAELAAQRGDWKRVAELGGIAYASDDQPNELTENFVFIEGYLRAGDLEQALILSEALIEQTDSSLRTPICSIWRQVERDRPQAFDLDYGSLCSP